MNFLLKIIEGPNKGAEIALVEGVAISLGKGDDCDIVLADPTLPDESMQIEASETGVTIGGEAFEQLHVKTVGATSFAVGPADAPWGALVWPKAEDRAANDPENPETPEETETPEKPETSEKPEKPETPATPAKKRRGCYGCIVALVLLLLVLAVLCWLFREEVHPHAEALWNRISQTSEGQCAEDIQHPTSDVRRVDLAAVVEKYGLLRAEANGTARISGNLKTRRERLAATAEAYEAMPGVELDLTDDESFRAAAEDALFTLTEGALKVVSVTNRVLVISGVSRSQDSLEKTLKSLNSDMPKLADVDVRSVRFGALPKISEDSGDSGLFGEPRVPAAKAPVRKHRASAPVFPVCGILTVPYPCLVMRDGKRVFEGASIGDSVILKIDADSVTVTNSAGRFEWKP